MIHIEEAVALATQRKPAPVVAPELSDEEQFMLTHLDYVVEHTIREKFNGEPLVLDNVPPQIAGSANVVAALRASYEQGGWSVAVNAAREGDEVKNFQFVFVPKAVAEENTKRGLSLPTVVHITSSAEPPKARLLVRMPTRGRHAQAIAMLGKYIGMAGMTIQTEVVVDYDDETLTTEALYCYSALGTTVTYGEHKSKIEACNGGRLHEWDILVLGSDDMMPVKDGWAVRIVELFEEHWPFFDGCLHLSDGYAFDRVCTLSVLGRRYYDRIGGYVYHRDYRSLFSDNEHTEVAQALGRIVYVPEVLIEHMHPAAGKGQLDALYVQNDALWQVDEETYKKRKAANFYQEPILLSVLISTFKERYAMLDRLLDYMNFQIQNLSPHYEIEIIIDHKPAPSLGEKRQRMLERAKGKYITFVDDDDFLDVRYFQRVGDALTKNPDVDCVSLVGVVTTNGHKPEKFVHSLKYTKWETLPNGLHVRTPNHISTVKTALALQAAFFSENYSEDYKYSNRLFPLLKTEADSGDEPLYHYWYRSKEVPKEAEVQ